MNAISIRIDEASSTELKNAIDLTNVGKAYIIETELSGIFKKEDVYYINNTLRMSPKFNCVRRIAFFTQNEKMKARIWLRGDIQKFLS